MSPQVTPARSVSLPRNTSAWSWRHSCRLLAPLLLGLVAQASTGCTLVGYGVGSAVTPAPHLLGSENVRAVPVGADVEVTYSPVSNEQLPIAGAPSVQGACNPTAELSVMTGVYWGTEAGNLVLETEVLRDGPTPPGYSSGGASRQFASTRATIPLDCVKTIRPKSSFAPRIIGALIGAALDVAATVLFAEAAHDIE